MLKVLGAGGMGVVFLAEDVRLGRPIALKAMLPEMAQKPDARERFLREARAAAALEHDHIVAIYQVDEDRGVPFIAMPLLKGMSLEDWLKRQPGGPAVPLKLSNVLKIGREIARGLAAAHERGLIHRDIKPANIWLDANAGGRVKILDFGLARPTSGEQNLTQSGMIVGTPAYMAPEQAHGRKVDARSDLFSLGVVLYRLCTGQLPFAGPDVVSTLMAVAMNTPVPPRRLNPDLPPKLAELVMSLLEKDPVRRIASAQEVVKAIQTIEQEQKGSRPASESQTLVAPVLEAVPSKKPMKTRRSRHLLVAAGVLIALIAGGDALGAIFLQFTTPDGKTTNIPLAPGTTIKIVEVKEPENKTPNPPIKPVPPPVVKAVSPFDRFQRKDIPIKMLTAAGRGDPKKAPAEIVAILGTSGVKDIAAAAIAAIDLSQDGETLALSYSGGWNSRVTLWDVATGKETLLAQGASLGERAPFPRFSHDGALLILGSCLWDIASKTNMQVLSTKPYRSLCFAFTLDDRAILIGSPDRDPKVDRGDPLSMKRILGRRPARKPVVFEKNDCSVHALALSPDGALAAVAGFEGPNFNAFVKLWDVSTGKVIRTICEKRRGVAFVRFSPDGKLLIKRHAFEHDIDVHDVKTGKLLRSYRSIHLPDQDAAFSPDSRWAASCDSWGAVHIWDAGTAEADRILHLSPPDSGEPNGGSPQVFWAPDARRLVVRNWDGTVYILRLTPPLETKAK